MSTKMVHTYTVHIRLKNVNSYKVLYLMCHSVLCHIIRNSLYYEPNLKVAVSW